MKIRNILNESPNHFLSLHSSCRIVKGYCRSTIIDLDSNNFYLVPNDLYNIIINFSNYCIKDIYRQYGKEEHEELHNYISFLLENNFCFLSTVDEKILFNPLPDSWDIPNHISNCIIDNNTLSNHDFESIFLQLNELMCSDIQIRFFNNIKIEQLSQLLLLSKGLFIKNIEFILPFSKSYNFKDIINILDSENRCSQIIFYCAPENAIRKSSYGKPIICISQEIKDHTSCGIISPQYFSINRDSYIESLQFNSCLNRKISIDVDGNIKNCPSMKKNYGNIKDTSLSEVINIPEFKKVWSINKDQIKVCKDCEFRYVCSDCRAYLESPNDIYSKPLKCGYDPYTNQWEEWSMNPLKQKTFEFYKEQMTTNR